MNTSWRAPSLFALATMTTGQGMFFTLLRQWVLTPITHYRLFHNFVRQDFFAQFSASVGGLLWLFMIPLIHIIIYAFVFAYIFQVRPLEEFGETRFIVFMMIGYLPWFAFAESIGKSTSLLLEKAPLITKVVFPVQIIPVVGTLVPYMTHVIGFLILLLYLIFEGYFNWLWIALPLVFFLQFLFTMGLVAILSALCVFLRDLQQLVALGIMVWFFLTPIIYPISMVSDESVRNLFLLNPMHSFVNFYRELILLGNFSLVNFEIIVVVSLLSYLVGGWVFMKIKLAFGDVL